MSRALTRIRPQLKAISHRHQAIMDLMLAQPDVTQREIAAVLGYTEAWVSQVIHSDVFQATYRKLYKDQFDTVVIGSREKLLGLAHQAMERVGEELQNAPTPRFALDTMNSTLRALGLADDARNTPSGVGDPLPAVNPQLLAEARGRIRARRVTVEEVEVQSGE